MSSSRKVGPGFNPTPARSRLTIQEFQDVANFFKDFLGDNPVIKWSIIAAGIGGIFEALHILWLFYRFVFRA